MEHHENYLAPEEVKDQNYEGSDLFIKNIFDKRRGEMIFSAIKDGVWSARNCQEYITNLHKLNIIEVQKHFKNDVESGIDPVERKKMVDGVFKKGLCRILKATNSSVDELEEGLVFTYISIEKQYRNRYEIIDNCQDITRYNSAVTPLYRTSLEASLWRAINSELKLGIPVNYLTETKYINKFIDFPEHGKGLFRFSLDYIEEDSIRWFYMSVSSVVYTKALYALRRNPELLTPRAIKLFKYAIACECDLYLNGSALIEIENECNKINPNCIPTRQGSKAFTVLAELTKKTVLGNWLDIDRMNNIVNDWDGLITTINLTKLFKSIQSKEVEKLGLMIRDESINARPITIVFDEVKNRLVEADAKISADSEAIVDILVSVIRNEINDGLLEKSKDLFERNQNTVEYKRLLSISEIIKSDHDSGIEIFALCDKGIIVSNILNSVDNYCNQTVNMKTDNLRDDIQQSILEAAEHMDFEKVSTLANQAKEIDQMLISRGTDLISELINESLLEAYACGHQILEAEKHKLEMAEASENNAKSIVKNNNALEGTILEAELKIEELEKTNAILKHRIDELSAVDNKPQATTINSDNQLIKKIIDDNLTLEDALTFVDNLKHVVVLPSAYQSASDSPYQNTKKALQTLMALTGPYYDAIANGKTSYNAANTHLGSGYRARESKTVQGNAKLRHEREFDVNGKKTLFIEHITLGGGRDPQSCMQIHFKIIDNVLYIGHCGTHLTVSSSN